MSRLPLYFKPKKGGAGSDSDSDGGGRRAHGAESSDADSSDDDAELLKDFDIIDVIPGLGEPPRNNQDFEIKYLKNESNEAMAMKTSLSAGATSTGTASSHKSSMTYSKYVTSTLPRYRIEVREDHFRKPLTKIDVLKAPDNFPVPLHVYCIQEISINWLLYGGNDFEPTDTSLASPVTEAGHSSEGELND